MDLIKVTSNLENGRDGIIVLPDGQKIDTTWGIEDIKKNCVIYDTDRRMSSGRKFIMIKHDGGMLWLWTNEKETKITAVSYFPKDGFGDEYKLWKRSFWN